MAYGLVQDTTLTRMGNAIRDKLIVSPTREEYVYCKGQAIYSPIAPDDAGDVIPQFETFTTQIDPIEGADKIAIYIEQVKTSLTTSYGAFLGDMTIYQQGYTINSRYIYNNDDWKEWPVTKISADTGGKVQLIASEFGLAIKVVAVALDADGNPIQGGDCPVLTTVTNTVTPQEMAVALESAAVVPATALELTGKCDYKFAYGGWDWFINNYADKITTKDISSCYHMFYRTAVSRIPFVINISDKCADFQHTLDGVYNLTECPKIRGNLTWSTVTNFNDILSMAEQLRYVDDLFTDDMMAGSETVKVTSAYTCPRFCMLNNMYSLRRVPSWFYKQKISPESTTLPNASYSIYYYLVNNCYVLDEIKNIYVQVCQGAATSNQFYYAFQGLNRAKSITFETSESGESIVANWKAQIIDLTRNVGFGTSASNFYSRNTGIIADKGVYDDASYQALKNDPDWWTTNREYSRYNHDSAVETINSLPDTSAYLATAGGTNTIKFRGNSGALTDGGAISNLTEEEIAVATAKGWTVTIS